MSENQNISPKDEIITPKVQHMPKPNLTYVPPVINANKSNMPMQAMQSKKSQSNISLILEILFAILITLIGAFIFFDKFM